MELNSPLISAIISAVVSFFVGLFFSDKSVERSQLRRHHSATLQVSIRDWINKIHDMCIIGKNVPLAKYSHEEDKMKPIELGDMASERVPHYQFLVNHMKSGYKDVWTQWNELRQRIHNHNSDKAELFENIRQQLLLDSSELNLTEYYYRPGRSRPQIYVAPDRIAESIFNEIKNRLSGTDNWWRSKPKIVESWYGNKLIYSLNISNSTYMIEDINSNNISHCIEFIISKVEDEDIINSVEQLLKMYKENYKKSDEIKDQLTEIISIIELGHNIKGKCKYCPKILGIF